MALDPPNAQGRPFKKGFLSRTNSSMLQIIAVRSLPLLSHHPNRRFLGKTLIFLSIIAPFFFREPTSELRVQQRLSEKEPRRTRTPFLRAWVLRKAQGRPFSEVLIEVSLKTSSYLSLTFLNEPLESPLFRLKKFGLSRKLRGDRFVKGAGSSYELLYIENTTSFSNSLQILLRVKSDS